jgi:hypothetical protein
LIFYDLGAPARYSSVATLPSPVDEDFDYGGTPTPMEVDSAITIEDARAAAREFLTTGLRPAAVEWVRTAG